MDPWGLFWKCKGQKLEELNTWKGRRNKLCGDKGTKGVTYIGCFNKKA